MKWCLKMALRIHESLFLIWIMPKTSILLTGHVIYNSLYNILTNESKLGMEKPFSTSLLAFAPFHFAPGLLSVLYLDWVLDNWIWLPSQSSFSKSSLKLYIPNTLNTDIHNGLWLQILNKGLNYRLFHSVFKFFWYITIILSWIEN